MTVPIIVRSINHVLFSDLYEEELLFYFILFSLYNILHSNTIRTGMVTRKTGKFIELTTKYIIYAYDMYVNTVIYKS